MFRILDSLFGKKSAAHGKRRCTAKKRRFGGLEALEDRRVMACAVAAMGPVLNVSCNAAADTVQLFDDGNNVVNGSATGFGAFAAAGITDINVNTGGGDDRVLYDLVGNLLPFEQRNVAVTLGSGNDRFDAHVLHDLRVGSSLVFNVQGGVGNDYMFVNASNDVDVAAGAQLKTLMYGQDGNDTMIMTYRGENDGRVYLREADGGRGDDTIRGHLQEDAGSTGAIWGQEHGGDGNDVMSLFVITPNAGQKGAIFGDAGVDTLFNSPNVVVFP